MTDFNARLQAGSCGPFTGELSVVVPVHNEAGNIRPLVVEIREALKDRVDRKSVV